MDERWIQLALCGGPCVVLCPSVQPDAVADLMPAWYRILGITPTHSLFLSYCYAYAVC